MWWVPVVAWAGALVVAIVVLGFVAYELVWKSRRLQRDQARLLGLQIELSAIQAELDAVRRRAARAAGR